jgi:sigma-B regulation protein RsbU (phosphoserine phosphatase)
MLTAGAEKIGAGNLKTRIEVKSESEIGKLASTFNQMAQDLEESTKAKIEKEKLTRELELAGEIQRELLPHEIPKTNKLDIAVSLSSATEVGGDCYDFIRTKNNELLFYVADVTGHGVPAGLVAAISNALVPAFLETLSSTEEIIVHLNRLLKAKTRPNVFITMVMGLWNSEKSLLTYTQAGHDPIIHFSAATQSVSDLKTGGMALGMVDEIRQITHSESLTIEEGDVIVLYTDGIPEAWENEKETYGMERFRKSVKKHSGLSSAQEIHDAILRDVRSFMGSYPQADDITLIVAKRTA